MFDFYSIIFILVFGFAFIIALIYSFCKFHISRKYFNKNCLQLYEDSIEEYDFSFNDSVEQIAQKMDKTIEYHKMTKEASIDKDRPNIIKVNELLSEEKKNFAVTHELGHSLRGYDSNVARNKKSIFSKLSPEEQICDYYAAAILLPKDDLKKKMDVVDYNNLNEESQIDFVRRIAKEKHIVDDVVYRRINEINMLYS